MASSFPARGLVADLYLPRPQRPARQSRTKRTTVFAAAAGFLIVLLCQVLQSGPSGEAATAQETPDAPCGNEYALVVHTLNHTSRTSNSNATLFTFDSAHLPFEFDTLRFDEFREDADSVSRYFAGMSLLAQAAGPDANIKFLEGEGILVEEIAYLGQSLIVLNGWETISKDCQGTVIDHRWGSMQIPAYDWRDDCWFPEDGILVEHPEDFTIDSAKLCLMVYEPSGTTEVPEFDPLPLCVVLGFVLMLARRMRR